MLTLLGSRSRYCDGVSRRHFLQVGALAMGGLTLPGLLRAEAKSGQSSHKSVIMVYLSGGLAHQDTFDLKPNAPKEIRGEFNPISTVLPGVQFSEHLPRLAKCADKLIVVRSLVGQRDEHSSFQSMVGATQSDTKRDNKPHFGSIVAKLQGQTDAVMPAFVDLAPTMVHKPYNTPGAGMLGRATAAVKVDGDEIAIMKNLAVPTDRLHDRKALLEGLDAYRKAAGRTYTPGMDTFHDRAFDVLTTSKLVDALNVSKESAATRERYGEGSSKHQGDGAPQWNEQLLIARRLVEAGARVVNVSYGFWDTHGQNFSTLKKRLPLFDQGISAMVEDLYARGLDRDVTVVVWGEFGRTPKFNKDAGRDHWARVNSALLFGGGMRVGQVIGSTDSAAGEAKDEPVPYQSVLATIYRNLGIDPHTMVTDVAGRPNPILPGGIGAIEKV